MKNLEYSTKVMNRDGKYICYIPELSLFFQDSKLSRCYETLNDAKQEKMNIMKEVNIHPIAKPFKKVTDQKLKDLFIKSASMALIVLVVFLILTLSINVLINQVINHRYMRLERKVLETLNPNEKKRIKRLNRFKSNIHKVEPYVKEVKSIITTESKR